MAVQIRCQQHKSTVTYFQYLSLMLETVNNLVFDSCACPPVGRLPHRLFSLLKHIRQWIVKLILFNDTTINLIDLTDSKQLLIFSQTFIYFLFAQILHQEVLFYIIVHPLGAWTCFDIVFHRKFNKIFYAELHANQNLRIIVCDRVFFIKLCGKGIFMYYM